MNPSTLIFTPIIFLQFLDFTYEKIDVDVAIYHFLMVLDGIFYQMRTLLGEAANVIALYSVEIAVRVVVGTLAKLDAIL